METIKDNFKEHEFHNEYDKDCSTCYRESMVESKDGGYDRSPRSIDFELASELSAHPSNLYW